MNSPDSSSTRYKKRKVGDEEDLTRKLSHDYESVGNHQSRESNQKYHSREENESSHRENSSDIPEKSQDDTLKNSEFRNYNGDRLAGDEREETSSNTCVSREYSDSTTTKHHDTGETEGETIVFVSKIPQPRRSDDSHGNPYEELIGMLREMCTIDNEMPQCQIPAKTRTLPYMYAFLNYETHAAAVKAVHMLDNVAFEELGCREPLLAKLTADRRKGSYFKDRYSDSRRSYPKRDRDSSIDRDYHRDRDRYQEERSGSFDKPRSRHDDSSRDLRHDTDSKSSYSRRSRSPDRRDSGYRKDLNRRSRSPHLAPRSPVGRDDYPTMKDVSTRSRSPTSGRRYSGTDRRDYASDAPVRDRQGPSGVAPLRRYDAPPRGYDKKRSYERGPSPRRDIDRRRSGGVVSRDDKSKRYMDDGRPEYDSRGANVPRDFDRRDAISDDRFPPAPVDDSLRRSEYRRGDYPPRENDRWGGDGDKRRSVVDNSLRRDSDFRREGDDRKRFQPPAYHEKDRPPYDDYRDTKSVVRDDYNRKEYRQPEFTPGRREDTPPYNRNASYNRTSPPRQQDYGSRSRDYGFRDNAPDQRDAGRDTYHAPRDVAKRDVYRDEDKRPGNGSEFGVRRESYNRNGSYQDRGRSR